MPPPKRVQRVAHARGGGEQSAPRQLYHEDYNGRTTEEHSGHDFRRSPSLDLDDETTTFSSMPPQKTGTPDAQALDAISALLVLFFVCYLLTIHWLPFLVYFSQCAPSYLLDHAVPSRPLPPHAHDITSIIWITNSFFLHACANSAASAG
jgi:hypothetical protein